MLKFFNEASLPLGQARPTLLETPPPDGAEDPVPVLDDLADEEVFDEVALLLLLLLLDEPELPVALDLAEELEEEEAVGLVLQRLALEEVARFFLAARAWCA